MTKENRSREWDELFYSIFIAAIVSHFVCSGFIFWVFDETHYLDAQAIGFILKYLTFAVCGFILYCLTFAACSVGFSWYGQKKKRA